MYKAFITIHSESPYHLPASEKGPGGLTRIPRMSFSICLYLCHFSLLWLLWAIWRQLAFLTPPAHYTHMHTLRDHDSLYTPRITELSPWSTGSHTVWSSATSLRPSWEWDTFSTALRTPSSYPWGLAILLLRGWDCCLTSWTLWTLIWFSLTSETRAPYLSPEAKKLHMPPDRKPWGSTIPSSWLTNYPPTLHLKQ